MVMGKFTIEINFEDLVDEMFYEATTDCDGYVEPSSTFKKALMDSVVGELKCGVLKSVVDNAREMIREQVQTQANEFIATELQGIILRKMRSGEVHSNRGYGFKNFDDLIEQAIGRISVERVIEQHIDKFSKAFAADMKKQYDNVFAARIVSSLNDQKMLSPEVAQILLGGNKE